MDRSSDSKSTVHRIHASDIRRDADADVDSIYIARTFHELHVSVHGK